MDGSNEETNLSKELEMTIIFIPIRPTKKTQEADDSEEIEKDSE